mmetsp:Transcript_2401/g.3568  ORF Transcript_2401/g.3568 Transcript_2401/m.3568 type:complete len:81 (+) Transcript_2401:607-849(+)
MDLEDLVAITAFNAASGLAKRQTQNPTPSNPTKNMARGRFSDTTMRDVIVIIRNNACVCCEIVPGRFDEFLGQCLRKPFE